MNTKQMHIQKALTPILLEKGMPSYNTVLDIEEKLNDPEVFNIAITGPYGSGKSTVLKTLQARDVNQKHKYLTISLASLTGTDWENPEKTMKPEEQQRIEYSILQQLIYREEPQTLPNSRFRRLKHITKGYAIGFGVAVIAFFVSLLVVFEPKWLRVDSFCDFFDLGTRWNLVADMVCSLIIVFCLFTVAAYLFRRSGFNRVKSLNVRNLKIELNQEASVFNKHLEEIVYFFEATNYDVVIIEDLDRFRCSEIFQKLREINFILRKSEVIKKRKRVIKFIYAIKDDLFTDSYERTKFFDYIATVTPVVNPDNSFDKLSTEFEERGYKVNREKLKELSEFVVDMRMLKNVANEFQQYMERISITSSPDAEKLLGMIIYKNHHPDDFGKLHYQQGKIYEFISKKTEWIQIATNKVIKPHRDSLEQKRRDYLDTQRFNMLQWRMIYMKKYEEHLKSFVNIVVNDKDYSLSDIYNDESLFEAFIDNQTVTYKYQDPFYSSKVLRTKSQDIPLSLVSQELGDTVGYHRRKRLAEEDLSSINAELLRLDEEETKLKSYKLSDLLIKFPEIQEDDAFKKIGLDNLMIRLLLRGYIDETYYDYLSVYDGKEMSIEDRRFLSHIKQNGPVADFDKHIDDVPLFVDRLPLFAYGYKSVLNYQIADFLENSPFVHKNALEQFENHVMKSPLPPLDFLASYYMHGGSGVELLWRKFVNEKESWQLIRTYERKEYMDTLVEAWLRFCGSSDITDDVRVWLNNNFGFCVEHLKSIDRQHLKDITKGCKFVNLSSLGQIDSTLKEDVMDFAFFVIDERLYELTDSNIFTICTLTSDPSKRIRFESMTLTNILNTNNQSFILNVLENISDVITAYLSKSQGQEEQNGLLSILNADNIEESLKKTYLDGQNSSKIDSVNEIKKAFRPLAVRTRVLRPSWTNVIDYYLGEDGVITEDLECFVNDHVDILVQEPFPKSKTSAAFARDLAMSNWLRLDVYRKILSLLSFALGPRNKTKIPDNLSIDRAELLVHSKYLSFNPDTADSLSEYGGSIYAYYLMTYLDEYISHFDDYVPNSQSLSLLISNEYGAPLGTRWALARRLSPKMISASVELANNVLALMWEKKAELNWPVVESVMLTATSNDNKRRFHEWLIKINKGDKNKISSVLRSMVEPYSDIMNESKKPLIPKSFKKCLDIILSIGLISSYKEEEKGYRIYHRTK